MAENKVTFRDRILTLLSGAFSSCALFIKYGDDIYHFNSPNSIGKDWKAVSEDIGVAMHIMRVEYETQRKK